MGKKIIAVILVLSAIGAGIFFYIGKDVYDMGWKGKPKKSDAIVVLGCRVYGYTPSPFLEARTKEGIRLLKEGYADYIIFTGGQGPGENITEAEAMKGIALRSGVDESKIILEDKSTSTYENLVNSKKIMKDRGLKTAIVVSNKYHIKRASLMCEAIGINASYSGIYVKEHKASETKGFIREVPALIKYYILKK